MLKTGQVDVKMSFLVYIPNLPYVDLEIKFILSKTVLSVKGQI